MRKKNILKAMLLAALGLSMINSQYINYEDDDDGDIYETLKVHIVPHSYNKELLRTVDVYFPSMQQELIQQHFDRLFD